MQSPHEINASRKEQVDTHLSLTSPDAPFDTNTWASTLGDPLTEGQFTSIVRGFECQQIDKGTIYSREGFPWLFIRTGNQVIATHKRHPLPDRYYTIV